MRYAMSGSVLVHAAIIGTALLGFAWPTPEDAPAPGAVTVDIVALESVSTIQSATIESSDAQDRVSAGSDPSQGEPVQSQTLQTVAAQTPLTTQALQQPLTPQTLEPVETALAPPQEPDFLAPDAAPTVQPIAPDAAPLAILATPATVIESASVMPVIPAPAAKAEIAPAPIQTATLLEPVSVSDAKSAPVPKTLSFERPSTPTPRPPKATPPPARAAGNGGRNAADTAASKAASGQQGTSGGGGTADIAPWERQVRRALANARRTHRGPAGDVVVRFTVSAAGALSGLRIIASSGNPKLDQAALDTVNRAAPFPPMPQGAGITAKTIDIPLRFSRD